MFVDPKPFLLTKLASGFSVSFGVFQNYYEKLPEFKGSPYIPVVGTLASGIPYLGGPVMAFFVRRYQHYRLHIIWIGWPLCILGLIAGSFTNSLGPLIFTQGIMYGSECKIILSHQLWDSDMHTSWLCDLPLPCPEYSKRVVDSPSRHGFWSHHQRRGCLGDCHASHHRGTAEQVWPQNVITSYRRGNGRPYGPSNPSNEEQAASFTGKRSHQNRLVLCLQASFPRVLFRQFRARSRVLLPVTLPAFIRHFHRPQRERRRHAALRDERRASSRPMDLRHTLRQDELEPPGPPLHHRHRASLFHVLGPRA